MLSGGTGLAVPLAPRPRTDCLSPFLVHSELPMSHVSLRSVRRNALLVFFVVLVGGVILQPGRGNPLPANDVTKAPAVAQGDATPTRS